MLQLIKQQLPALYQDKAPQFEKFLQLLLHWNKTYNLTAIRDPKDMIPLHIYDCISIIPYLKGPQIADIGTGAGFPGIPVAICCPELKLTLIESNRKRVMFLQTVKHELQLNNINIWQGRVEEYQPPMTFDTITSRAFSDVAQLMSLSKHLCAHDGQWCAMKGQVPHQELEGIPYPFEIFPYTIPGQNVARCCIVINNKE
ncbi:MAG: 16S rRNA (guanine(527)-N(7))-methyltransferase RsmG [Gammaproteobacteria bacterium]|nr:16S rRNA (guanine(527)-N(7))-methyltransferase RsmG [Gammaproteobacteria bacterium]